MGQTAGAATTTILPLDRPFADDKVQTQALTPIPIEYGVIAEGIVDTLAHFAAPQALTSCGGTPAGAIGPAALQMTLGSLLRGARR